MKYFLYVLLLFPQVLYAQYKEQCFKMDKSRDVDSFSLALLAVQDTVQQLSFERGIYGFSVSGTVTLSEEDSYVRIILKDKYDYDYLVYENYPLLSSTKNIGFEKVCIETAELNEVTPKQLIINVNKATIKVDSIYYSMKRSSLSRKNLECTQALSVIENLNKNLSDRNMTWRAGLTDVALMSYEEKKSLFGGKVPELYGGEYYIGGILVMPDSYSESEVRMSQYVNTWDWRNRHGKNWMTSVKNQGSCGACWAFSAIGTVEAYANLYYNKLIGLNLSEEELISCSGSGCGGGSASTGLSYIKNNGIVSESCFPYTAYEQNCDNKCSAPNEQVSIGGYVAVSLSTGENSIKEKLFKCPLTVSLTRWGHAIVIVGYKEIQIGDVIYSGNANYSSPIVINSNEHGHLIGKTAWLLKNSWGTSWGDNGYFYVVADISNLRRVYSPSGQVESMNYDDSDVVCEDADGDGYYFWGIGPKPAYCPSWVPDTPDGNDASYSQGAMNQYGVLESLNPNQSSPLIINGNQTYTTQQSAYSHIDIKPDATLIVSGVLNMFGRSAITVENGGKLIVDGGVITNADIQLQSGSQLQLMNGGVIVVRTNSDFYAPVGSVVNATHGKICKSSDFSSF